jgi:hypothetical protein
MDFGYEFPPPSYKDTKEKSLVACLVVTGKKIGFFARAKNYHTCKGLVVGAGGDYNHIEFAFYGKDDS